MGVSRASARWRVGVRWTTRARCRGVTTWTRGFLFTRSVAVASARGGRAGGGRARARWISKRAGGGSRRTGLDGTVVSFSVWISYCLPIGDGASGQSDRAVDFARGTG